MKKNLLGLFALVLAITFSSFTIFKTSYDGRIWANNGEKYVLVEDYEPGLCLPESEEICVVQEVDNQPQIGSEFSYSEANEFLSEAEIAPLENSEEGVYQGF